jgi:hypothetical protein
MSHKVTSKLPYHSVGSLFPFPMLTLSLPFLTLSLTIALELGVAGNVVPVSTIYTLGSNSNLIMSGNFMAHITI